VLARGLAAVAGHAVMQMPRFLLGWLGHMAHNKSAASSSVAGGVVALSSLCGVPCPVLASTSASACGRAAGIGRAAWGFTVRQLCCSLAFWRPVRAHCILRTVV